MCQPMAGKVLTFRIMLGSAICLTFIGCSSVQTPHAFATELSQVQAERSQFSINGQYRFGLHTFDFDRGQLSHMFWRGRTVPLQDCSNEIFYCFATPEISLTIPRSCDALTQASVGDVWQTGSVRTRVVWKAAGQLSLHFIERNGLYLVNPDNPNIVFRYRLRSLGSLASDLAIFYRDSPERLAIDARPLIDLAESGVMASDQFTIPLLPHMNTVNGSASLTSDAPHFLPCTAQ